MCKFGRQTCLNLLSLRQSSAVALHLRTALLSGTSATTLHQTKHGTIHTFLKPVCAPISYFDLLHQLRRFDIGIHIVCIHHNIACPHSELLSPSTSALDVALPMKSHYLSNFHHRVTSVKTQMRSPTPSSFPIANFAMLLLSTNSAKL